MSTRMSAMAWGVRPSPTLGDHSPLPAVLRASTKAPDQKQLCWMSGSGKRTTPRPPASSSLHDRTRRGCSGLWESPTPTPSGWDQWALANLAVPVFLAWRRMRKERAMKTGACPLPHRLLRWYFAASPLTHRHPRLPLVTD